MKMAVVNWKGGVGKTTIATQVLPVFYKELNFIPFVFIEVDLLNREIQKYSSGSLNFSTIEINPNEIDTQIVEILGYEHAIIDTGANEIAKLFAEKLNELLISDEIDYVVIPVEANNQESINKALEVKSLFPEERVIWGLNKVNLDLPLSMQFSYKNFMEEEILPNPAGVLVIPNSGVLQYLKNRSEMLLDFHSEKIMNKLIEKRKQVRTELQELNKKKQLEGLTDEEELRRKELFETLQTLLNQTAVYKKAVDLYRFIAKQSVVLEGRDNPVLEEIPL